MDLLAAETERQLRFYRWGAARLREQIEEDYPLLTQLSHPQVAAVVRRLRTRSLEQQLRLSSFMLQEAHPEACAILGESLSFDEAAEFASWRAEVKKARGRIRIDRDKLPMRRRRLATLVMSLIGPMIGSAPVNSSKFSWDYATSFGDWNVRTSVNLEGGFARTLVVTHLIMRSDWSAAALLPISLAPHVPPRFSSSCLQEMGFAGSDWDVPNEPDEAPVAHSVLLTFTRLWEALPELLAGLNVGG